MSFKRQIIFLLLTVASYGATLNVKNAPYNAVGDGVANDGVAIQAALTAAVGGDTVLFPCGTYLITNALVANKSITVAGSLNAGAQCVTIRKTNAGTMLTMQGSGLGSTVTVTANTLDQANTITTSAGISGVVVGDYVVLAEGGKDSSTGSTDTQCDVSGCRGDVMKIASISGFVYTTTRPLSHPYNSLNAPTVRKMNSPITFTLRDMTLDGTNTADNGIVFQYTINSLIQNVIAKNFNTGSGSSFFSRYGWGNQFLQLTAIQCGSPNQGCFDIRNQNMATYTTIDVTANGTGHNFGFSPYIHNDSSFQQININMNGSTGRGLKTVASGHNNWLDFSVINTTGGTSTFAPEYYSHHNIFTNCRASNNVGHALATFGNYNDNNQFINCTVTATSGYNAFAQPGSFDSTANDHFTTIRGGTWTGGGSAAVLQMNSKNLTMIGVNVVGPGTSGLALGGLAGEVVNNSCVKNNVFSGTISAGADINFTSGGGTNNVFSGNTTPHGTSPASLPTGTCAPTDIYLSPSGNDANACTSLLPCLTFSRANTLAQSADTVHVLAGTYSVTHIDTTKASVTWVAEPSQSAIIISTATDYIWNSTGDNVIIDGFDISGAGTFGIKTTGNNPIIRTNHIHSLTGACNPAVGGAAIYIGGVSSTQGSIYRNRIHDINNGTWATVSCSVVDGIQVTHPQVVVDDNIIYKAWTWGITTSDSASDITISHNLLFQNGQGAINIGSLAPVANCRSIISNNISMRNSASWSASTTITETNTVGPSGVSANKFLNNLYFNNKNPDIAVITGTQTGAVDADPRLGNYQDDGSGEYHLQSSSPAINAGTNTGSFSPDYDGVTRPQGAARDIGPSEFIPILTSTNWPKVSTTTKTIQTGNNTALPNWTEGAASPWTGCSGYHCTITTKGLNACDGTTAAPSFCENVIPRPANVSGIDDGVSIRDLLYSGSTTHLMAHYLPWFCPTGTRCNGHLNLGINSNTTAQVTKEIQEMKDLGFQGVQGEWHGRPYGSASYPNICAANNQKIKCYLDEGLLKVKSVIDTNPAFSAMDYSIVYSSEANNDCDASPSPTNCGDGTTTSCGYVNDIANDDTKQHCSNSPNTLCTQNTDCPAGGSCVWDGCTHNDKAVTDLKWLQDNYFGNKYQTDGGQPVVYLFGLSGSSIDWPGVLASTVLTSNPKIISRFNNGSNPMTETSMSGGWGWQGRPSSDCYGYTTTFAGGPAESTGCGTETCPAHGTDILACASTRAQAAPSKLYAEGLHTQHDNRPTPWGAPNGGSAPIKIDPPFCGTTWLKTFSVLNSKWSSANQLKYAVQVTWNDIDEASGLVQGIESCWRFQPGSPYLAGNMLNWIIEKYDIDGTGPALAADASLTVLDHFRLFISGAGISPTGASGDPLNNAVDIPAATGGTCGATTCTFSYNLTNLGLNGGLHYISLKLVGKSGIQTKYSPPVYYAGTGGIPVPNNPPVVTLSLSPTTGIVPILTTATISATDSDGTIVLATLDWGDGTVDTVTGLTSKTHTYNAIGTYTAVYSATDDKAAVSTTTKTFVATTASNPGRKHRPRGDN